MAFRTLALSEQSECVEQPVRETITMPRDAWRRIAALLLLVAAVTAGCIAFETEITALLMMEALIDPRTDAAG